MLFLNYNILFENNDNYDRNNYSFIAYYILKVAYIYLLAFKKSAELYITINQNIISD